MPVQNTSVSRNQALPVVDRPGLPRGPRLNYGLIPGVRSSISPLCIAGHGRLVKRHWSRPFSTQSQISSGSRESLVEGLLPCSRLMAPTRAAWNRVSTALVRPNSKCLACGRIARPGCHRHFSQAKSGNALKCASTSFSAYTYLHELEAS